MRKTISAAIGFALVLTLSANAFAAPFDRGTGNTFYATCKNNASGICEGLVSGMLVMFIWAKVKPLCVPDNVQPSQLKDVFLKELEKHPEDRHNPVPLLFAASMVENFPCP